MRPSRHLRRLHNATQYRLKRLLDLYSAIPLKSTPQQGRDLAYIAIELDNLNICALRAFAISTIRCARTLSGKKITSNRILAAEGEVGAYMLSVLNPVKFGKLNSPITVIRTEEPTVRDPKEIRKILVDCNASNISSLDNALSLNSSLFRDIKTIRHFYAHRCEDTFLKARTNSASLGLPHPKHPDEILKHVVVGKTISVLEDWIIEAQIFYELLMD